MMHTQGIALAQSEPLNFVNTGWQTVHHSTDDLVIVIGAVALVILAFLVWAAFLRKRKKEVSGWRVSHSHSSSASGETGTGQASGRRRRRRRRREHRPRNPTLAETGGLPPPRTERQNENTL